MQHLLKVRDQSIQNQQQEIAVCAAIHNNDGFDCAILLPILLHYHCLFLNVHSFHYRLSVSTVVEYLSVCRNFRTELQGGGKEAATADPGFREGEGPLWEGCR